MKPLLFVLLLSFSGALHALCEDPRAVPAGSAVNGFYLGADGCFFDPAAIAFEDVPPVGDPNAPRLVYLNGANPTPVRELEKLTLLAASAGQAVIGIYGEVRTADGTAQQLNDIQPAVGTLAALVLAHAQAGQALHLRGGSLGGTLIAQGLALGKAKALLQLGPRRALAALRQFKVETAGGVALWYPDGPQYVHYANLLDSNARRLGVLSLPAAPGLGSVIALFIDTAPPMEDAYEVLDPETYRALERHGFSVYLDNRRPFEAVYEHQRIHGIRDYLWVSRLPAG
ncbi:MAG TPA: hypothetical protein QF361_00625 [Gammaproteobacteria bacterium]|nr:hypothetical protein [Gammaproteobacteria bacterium]